MSSLVSTETREESQTPRRTLHYRYDGRDDDEMEDEETTTDESDRDLLQLEHSNSNREQQGFLKANNSSDAYFLAHGKANPTSNELLSERADWTSPLQVSDYLHAFHPQPLQSAQLNWKQWTAELMEGYSLLFHGLGSKRVTLNEFVGRHLVESLGWEALIINGFQNGVDLSSILKELEEMILSTGIEGDEELTQLKPKTTNSSLELMESRARRLCTLLDRKTSSLFRCVIMIHNLDGIAFRNPRVQTILSLLSAQPSIHFIASLDHLYAPVLLPSSMASGNPDVKESSQLLKACPSNYNFLYHHLPTPTPYTLESLLSGTISNLVPSKIFPPTMIGSQGIQSDITALEATTAKATLHVLSSLTQKAKSLFRILAEYQILQYQSLPSHQANQIDATMKTPGHSEDRKTPKIAISATKLFGLARTEFVASAPSQMEALLIEFRDHTIVLASLSPPGGLDSSDAHHDRIFEDHDEWLWIGLSLQDLEYVLSKLDEL